MSDPVRDLAGQSVKPGEPPRQRLLRFLKNLGPGLITGAADDDPAGISTYSVTGASTGLSMLWIALITTPMMAVVQGMCARIGMVTGIGLAAQMRASFPRWLAMSLAAIVVHPNWLDVLRHAVIPEFHLTGPWITTLVGVLGTTISPYLFFWQSSLMVEEEKQLGRSTIAQRRGATPEEIADAHADVNTGMVYSNAIMFFIITTTAVTLYAHGKHDIATAQDAAEALRPLAGDFAYLLFAIGMIGTGMLAIPVLAGSSAYVAAEVLNFKEGLNERPSSASQFYVILIGGMVIGVLMNAVHVDPIKALFYSAVLNGVAAVPLVFAVVHLASSRKVMGRWVSSVLARCWGWATFALMFVSCVLMFVYWNQ